MKRLYAGLAVTAMSCVLLVGCASPEPTPTPQTIPTVDVDATVRRFVEQTAEADKAFESAVTAAVRSTREANPVPATATPLPSPTLLPTVTLVPPTATVTPKATPSPTPTPAPHITGDLRIELLEVVEQDSGFTGYVQQLRNYILVNDTEYFVKGGILFQFVDNAALTFNASNPGRGFSLEPNSVMPIQLEWNIRSNLLPIELKSIEWYRVDYVNPDRLNAPNNQIVSLVDDLVENHSPRSQTIMAICTGPFQGFKLTKSIIEAIESRFGLSGSTFGRIVWLDRTLASGEKARLPLYPEDTCELRPYTHGW